MNGNTALSDQRSRPRFLLDQWYFAAFDFEVTSIAPLGRSFAGVPVVMWRTRDAVVALHDVCPHRFLPLSRGQLVDGEIECWYHGLRFDRSGACTRVPSQDLVPKSARTRNFPVVERHGAIWVWVGDADTADASKIPDFCYHDHPDWVDMGHGFIPIKAHCQLVVDNLLDLSHIAFVHRRTVGNAGSAEAETTTKVEGDTVTVERWLWNQPPVPLWRAAFGDYSGNVDHWLNIHWQPPGYIFMDVGVTPVGRPREEGIYSLTSHILVPADERSTYYFWCSSRKPNWGNRSIDENWTKAVNFTFHEDQEIIEVQQNLLDKLAIDDCVDGYTFPLSVASDTGPLHARRIMQRLLHAERATMLRRSAG